MPEMPSTILVLNELADAQTVERLTKHRDIPDVERKMLSNYAKKITHGQVAVDYAYSQRIHYLKSKQLVSIPYGRRYAQKYGLSRFSRRTRATIAKDNYYDIDFENSHLNILKQFLITNNISTNFPNLIDYVDNRPQHLQALMNLGMTRDQAKQLYLRLTYCGSALAHCEELGFDPADLPASVPAFETEIKQASNWITKNDFAEQEVIGNIRTINKHLSGQNKIRQNSYLSCLLNYIEDKCLTALHTFLNLNGFQVDVLMFDGLMVRKQDGKEITQELLDRATQHIYDEHRYTIPLAVKEFAEPYDLADVIDTPTDDDQPNYECEFDIDLSGVELTKYNPVVAHDWKDISNRERYFKTRAYVENFIGYCRDPNTYLFNPNPKETNTPLYFSKEQITAEMAMLPCQSLTDGAKRNNTFAQLYFADPYRKYYKKLDFVPYKPCEQPPSEIYNLFNGYSQNVTTAYDPSQRDELTKHFRSLVRHMSGDDDACEEYATKWLADILQNPAVKTGTMWCITGSQGTGKGTLLEAMRQVLGKELVMETTSADQLFGTYAEGCVGKLLVNANEIQLSKTKEYEHALKSATTDKELTVNPKGIRAYTVNSYARFLMTTNKPDPIPVDVASGDRRVFLTRCSDATLAWNKQYWCDVYETFRNPQAIAATYDYLMSQDLRGFDFQRDRPITEPLKNLYEINTGSELHFLANLFNSPEAHFGDDWNEVKTEPRSTFYARFKNYCEASGIDKPMTAHRFCSHLNSIFYNETAFRPHQGKVRCWRYTPSAVREYLGKKYEHLF